MMSGDKKIWGSIAIVGLIVGAAWYFWPEKAKVQETVPTPKPAVVALTLSQLEQVRDFLLKDERFRQDMLFEFCKECGGKEEPVDLTAAPAVVAPVKIPPVVTPKPHKAKNAPKKAPEAKQAPVVVPPVIPAPEPQKSDVQGCPPLLPAVHPEGGPPKNRKVLGDYE